MDCDGTYHRMYHYLDGELTVWRRWKITRHLNKCPPCAQGFDFEVELRQVISTRCRDEVPPDLRRRIAESIGIEWPTGGVTGGPTPGPDPNDGPLR